MKILVRLPNWLGDMVMSVGFINQLPHFFPGAAISVIAKKGVEDILHFFPATEHQFIFSKNEFKGINGAISFGKMISATEKFDLFFSLPNSFSAALVGFASGAKKKVGYKKEMRQLLLTDAFSKPKNIHRVEEYVQLLELFSGDKAGAINVSLQHHFQKKGHVVVNINSEATSRRLTVTKAVELLNVLRSKINQKIILIGAPKEKEFVDNVFFQLHDNSNIENASGKTSLLQLAEVLSSAQLMLSTDSGPAHLANALGTHTVVLFGAGNEKNTAPYNQNLRTIIRLGQLSCEPCEKNICTRYDTPQCLERLDSTLIIEAVKMQLTT